jgi:hypothetical protein
MLGMLVSMALVAVIFVWFFKDFRESFEFDSKILDSRD